jgi:hypothetical protein
MAYQFAFATLPKTRKAAPSLWPGAALNVCYAIICRALEMVSPSLRDVGNEKRRLEERRFFVLPYRPDYSGVGSRWSQGPPATHRGAFEYYSVIFETTPAPTVRPPSRIAKRRPCSIAMGAMSSTLNLRLSPGITISVPSGSSTVPVTSVVRK